MAEGYYCQFWLNVEHLRDQREATHGQCSSEFVVTRDHNICEVTVVRVHGNPVQPGLAASTAAGCVCGTELINPVIISNRHSDAVNTTYCYCRLLNTTICCTVAYGQELQHLRYYRDSIHGHCFPQFFVTRAHNIPANIISDVGTSTDR